MFTISSISKKLLEKLSRKAYRAAYVGEHVRRGIAAQIRAMREQRGWNQGKLSTELEKPQSVVSRLEDPSYGKVTVQTLLEVAATFDVALQIRFVPFSSFLQQTRDVSTSSMRVVSFSDDFAAQTRASDVFAAQTRASQEIRVPRSVSGKTIITNVSTTDDAMDWLDVPLSATPSDLGVVRVN